MTKIKMHISKAKLPFYPPCEVKCGLQNGVLTAACFDLDCDGEGHVLSYHTALRYHD